VNLSIKALIQKIPHSVKLAILFVALTKIMVLTISYVVTYLNSGPAPPLTILMNMLNHWDAQNYEAIAKNWYVNSGDAANLIVFFPLYPILIHLFTLDFNYISLSALIISNVCSLIAFFYLYKLTKLEFNDGIAVKAVLFISVFPTAYFLAAPYTESLFFALAIACIYYARLGKWQFAGLISLLASLTRIAGLLLLPVLLIEYFHQKGWKPGKIDLSVLWVFLALAGFRIYLFINYQVTGNSFMFMDVEAAHWFNKLDPWSGLTGAYSWARDASYPDNITIGFAPLVFAVFGLVMVGVSVWRRLRPVYVVYMSLSWALAVSTSWWISVPRYIMAMFPMFILLGSLTNRKTINIAIVLVSGAALCCFTVFFALGWWAF
jgi:Gpi18-like mannosyltransferase